MLRYQKPNHQLRGHRHQKLLLVNFPGYLYTSALIERLRSVCLFTYADCIIHRDLSFSLLLRGWVLLYPIMTLHPVSRRAGRSLQVMSLNEKSLVWKNSNCFLQPYQLLWNMLRFTFRSYFSLVRSPDQNIHPGRLWKFGPHYLCWKTVPNTIPNLDGFNHGPSKER